MPEKDVNMNLTSLTIKICLFASVLYAIHIVLTYAVDQRIQLFSLGMAVLMLAIAACAAHRDRVRE
ncbi:MAG: hypothetical protein D6730_11575 [Bacteroidetes bacterium]|nr:MAG: hypothetical protein D6730_11575 [Bacteroidota bacterium]